jgi:hypothetical protein
LLPKRLALVDGFELFFTHHHSNPIPAKLAQRYVGRIKVLNDVAKNSQSFHINPNNQLSLGGLDEHAWRLNEIPQDGSTHLTISCFFFHLFTGNEGTDSCGRVWDAVETADAHVAETFGTICEQADVDAPD